MLSVSPIGQITWLCGERPICEAVGVRSVRPIGPLSHLSWPVSLISWLIGLLRPVESDRPHRPDSHGLTDRPLTTKSCDLSNRTLRSVRGCVHERPCLDSHGLPHRSHDFVVRGRIWPLTADQTLDSTPGKGVQSSGPSDWFHGRTHCFAW